ncbi:MAG: acyl-CoA dehydrogenase [Alphaproteobacteria bacterium]|nr:MAG: acyl-CoA dehydrogenase [Alphaproteobacteria bacterium]
MPSYSAPVNDIKFLLHDYFNLQQHNHMPAFAEATPDLLDAILDEAAKVTENVFQPLNLPADEQGCRLEDGKVITPDGFKEAYNQYVEGGWQGMSGDVKYGGQGLPQTLGLVLNELMVSANWGFAMYPGLTKGATESIYAWGTDEQKDLYLPKMYAAEWAGTMNLTEPHCGTDLGLLRTKAEPAGDDSYKITGTKIFISAGDHDLTENIIHLVLARIPGGPEGIKGISLFIVPRNTINPDGSIGDNNGVTCGSLEEKMGIHSNATCVMNFDGATGYLLGDKHRGMKAMFTMMNEARLGVAIQGLAIAEVANQNAVAYANDRIQGRALTGAKNPDDKADPIIVHPDVRRMLMTNRAFIEGSRAMAIWAGILVDTTREHADEAERAKADEMLALITPVLKSYLTDQGVEAASRALQCFGGHGYIREWGMEQFLRDSRIAPIYEGTNGIQAMDLIGRKLPANGGAAIRAYFDMIQTFIDDNKSNESLAKYIPLLEKALGRLQAASMWLMQNGMENPNNAGSGAHYYLNLLALVTMGYFWADMARKASEMLAAGEGDKTFLENKLITADFFFGHMLPETSSLKVKIEAGATSVMGLDAQSF